MDEWETKAKYNIAETCCDSISVDQLQEFSDQKDAPENAKSILPSSKRMGYGEIRGSKELRQNLANLYSSKVGTPLPIDNILITQGAIAANILVFYALIQPGDHVIVHYPTYQQLYAVPASLGASVSLWHARPEKDWIPDLDELKALVTEKTKMIVINNPNNPTGAILPKALLQSIVSLAADHAITVLSDEVYRPIFHSTTPLDASFPPSLLSLGAANTLATGSLSKAYALAGIRVGWVASRSAALTERIYAARHYTTLSVSQLDSAVAAFALSPAVVHRLLARNIALAKANLRVLERFVVKHDDVVEWVRPVAGTTAFLRFHRGGRPVDDLVLCTRLVQETGVLWCPGRHCFGRDRDFAGFVRVGFCCAEEVLKEGLEKVRLWMRKEFDDLPLAENAEGTDGEAERVLEVSEHVRQVD